MLEAQIYPQLAHNSSNLSLDGSHNINLSPYGSHNTSEFQHHDRNGLMRKFWIKTMHLPLLICDMGNHILKTQSY